MKHIKMPTCKWSAKSNSHCLLPATRDMDSTFIGAGGASLRVQLEINTD